ncbi:hypothetical protein A2886_01815 [candidate division WWE3 bacterium RIFCSPHIGHO2_01_FULL_42_13]|uniref:DUF5667 domain-containing protein n=1 Tax=candidate division WWE3 bacterium RIFCSPHIGHO2_01_FULL_42_13 TaxID=1802617 RepID=A0A1F4US62_UNCKA|nr:MAG: hypothetical protein A2886_01815 [candidate division WWE3 bacterium RIFCSPHIGHO2_01_FULL_42_13]
MTKLKQGLLIVLGSSIILLLLSPQTNPDFPELYKVKRLQEKIFFTLQSTPLRKVVYYRTLLNTRVQELQNLVKNRNYDYILSSSLRYSTTAGNLTELILQNDLSDQIPPTLEQFKSHQEIFRFLLIDYPTEDNDSWKYLQDDINYLTIYSGFLLE